MLKARRFWKSAEVSPCDDGFGVRLDGRPVRTPAKTELRVPTAAAADAIAREWQDVVSDIDPRAMPVTRWANSAIDKVLPQRAGVVAMLAEYGGSDLLCYRATAPEGLVARQAEAWDAPLSWARTELGAPLVVTTGVLPVAQPPASLDRMRDALDRFDPFELAAVHDLVTLSGSLVLGLGVALNGMRVDDAWTASRVDEMWQAELWGADEEAESAATAKESDFRHAARMLELLRQ